MSNRLIIFVVAAMTSLIMSAAPASADCTKISIYAGFSLKVCNDDDGLQLVGSWGDFDLQAVDFLPYYDAEDGTRYTDESSTEFSLPGMAGLGVKVQIRVLRQDRNDHSGIFEKEGDVIYAFYYWDALVNPLTHQSVI
jgi:hypothetical protein